jgi:microcin C transport system substrate-binding protein
MERWIFLAGCLLFTWSLVIEVPAAPSAALGYTPYYEPGFKNFNYVNPDAPKGGELILSGVGNFDSFNPYLLKGIAATGLSLVFETLMEKSQDEPFSLYGLVAEDIELAKDELSVTFRLNPQARFTDGSPVTAADVKFSFDTLKSEHAHPQYRIYWNDIQAAEIIDNRNIRFRFAKKNPELHLIAAEIPVFAQASVAGKAFDTIVTKPLLASGPYVIDQYQMGKYITYKRNPHYWAKDLNTRRGMHNFERITFKYYQDREISLEALKSGEFDFMAVYESKAWARDYIGPKFDSGEIKKTELPHSNNAGMQGFVFNLRRPIFQDIRVRQAINLAFDFEWANKNLFFDQYERCDSYFSNSDLAARGLPSEAELALLKPLSEQFPEQFPQTSLTQVWQPVSTKSPYSLRANLRQAQKLLTEAGWYLQNGVLQNKAGVHLEFEALLAQKGFERILAPFARNLEKLGIKLNYRTVDVALYQRRQDTFDFDLVVTIFGQSQSPGNELRSMWHSSAADQEGSNNLIGLKNPLVDALIEKVIYASNRQALVTAVHALDRVMLAGEYVIPNWYTGRHRIAYWNKFGQPSKQPLYYQAEDWVMRTWWQQGDKNRVARR